MRSRSLEFRIGSLVVAGVLFISCASFHVAEGKESKSIQLKYNYCKEINDEISTIAKYDEDLLVATLVEQESDSDTIVSDSKVSTKKKSDTELVAQIDKIFSDEREKEVEKKVAKDTKEKSTAKATTAVAATTEVAETSKSVVSLDLKTKEKTYKETTKTEEKKTSTPKKSGGKLVRGSNGDKKVTKSSIKNSSASVATDNAGNTYRKGDMIANFTVTGYCTSCNDPKGSRATASGKTATAGITIAVNKQQIPLGTKVIIGDHVYIAEDVHGNRNYDRVADIYFGGSAYHGTEPLIHNVPIYIAIEDK